MAGLKAAVANGNWSSPSTWTGGTLPQIDDTVASNGFTVTIDQNITADNLTNSAQTNIGIVPIMTSNTTPVGVAFSNNYTTGNEPYRAFDAPAAGQGYFSQNSPSVSVPIHLGYEFTSSKVVIKYSYTAHNASISYSPVDFTFEAWDGVNWIVLHTVVGHNAITYSSPTLSNTTAYLKYRLNVTKSGGNNYQIRQLSFFDANSGTIDAVTGGGFILNSGVTVTCTNTGDGITSATGTCITYSGTGTSTINANILGSTTGTTGCIGVRVTGTGVLNIYGNLVGYRIASSNNIRALSIEANATVNLTGNISVPNNYTVYIASQCTFNIVGNVYVGTYNQTNTIYCTGTNAVINLTGNIYGQGGTTGWSMTGIYLAAICTLNVTGNLIGFNIDSRSHYLISVGANATVNITGTMQSGINGNIDYGEVCFTSTANHYLNHIGSVISSLSGYALYSTGSGAINLLTGPFISGTTGTQPFYVARMHYRRTMGSYFEFRDNSTNGALPPAGSAPATRLVSPDTAVDAPSPANVRFGTVYALGSQTGTMKVPAAANVRLGVEVDNTTGTAVLAPGDVWDYLRTNMNTSGSIGERLKNASTVDSTGTQIASITI